MKYAPLSWRTQHGNQGFSETTPASIVRKEKGWSLRENRLGNKLMADGRSKEPIAVGIWREREMLVQPFGGRFVTSLSM